MKLLLPATIVKRLRCKLRGRHREIGGVLVGESVGDDAFRIVDISVQLSGGSSSHFLRDPKHSMKFLDEFFARTGHDYQRFNYLGEWHSHPAFEPLPSAPDFRTMFDIVEDPHVGANFAVLIVVRLRGRQLHLSATLFRAGVMPEPADVEIEQDAEEEGRQAVLSRIRDVLWRWRRR